VKPVIEVDWLLGRVMVAVPGLPGKADQVPIPTADMIAVPPGTVYVHANLSGPAFGFAVTVTLATSVQVPLVKV